MTSTDPSEADPVSRARLARAAHQLRGRTHPRAVEIANDVLTAALRSSRPSLSVRTRSSRDHIYVSDQVLIDRLRHRIDTDVARCAVGRIYLRVDPDATLQEATVELYVQYGEVLMDVADQARDSAAAVLTELLGAAPVPVVDLVLTHVHVSDITIGDPGLVDPADEVL